MKLQEYLDKYGIKKCWLAQQLGIGENTVGKWAREKPKPPATKWPLIEKVTNGQVTAEDWKNEKS